MVRRIVHCNPYLSLNSEILMVAATVIFARCRLIVNVEVPPSRPINADSTQIR